MASVNETVSRSVRTGTQGGIAWAILEVVDSAIWNMPERTYGALLVLLTALLGSAQVLLENRVGWAFLRNLPSEPQHVIENVEGRHEA